MCLLISSAFEGFSAVCDTQALAASDTSIDSVLGKASKNFMLNEMFCMNFETFDNIILFQHTCARTCKKIYGGDSTTQINTYDTSYSSVGYLH